MKNWGSVAIAGLALSLPLSGCGGGGPVGSGGGGIPGSLGSASFNISGAAQDPVIRVGTQVTVMGIAGADFSNFVVQDSVTQPIVFTSAEDQTPRLYAMTQTGGMRTRLYDLHNVPQGQSNPSISPKGDRAFFEIKVSPTRSVIAAHVFGIDGLAFSYGSAGATSSDTSPSVGPTGDSVAFVSDADGNKEIWLLHAPSNTFTQLTFTSGGVVNDHPCFSPDGRTIYYSSNLPGNNEIYSYSLAGGVSTRLTTNTADDIEPSISPNNLYVIWSSNRTGNYDIFRMFSLNGVLPTQLTTDSHEDREPSYFPDGSKIIFTSNRDDTVAPITDEVYTMAANGTSQTRISIDSSYNQRSASVAPIIAVTLSQIMMANGAGLIVSQVNGAAGSILTFDTTDPATAVRAEARVVADPLPSTSVSSISFTITTTDTLYGIDYTKPGVTVVPSAVKLRFAVAPTNALVTFAATGTLAGQVISVVPYRANRSALKKKEDNGLLKIEGEVLGAYDAIGKNVAPGGASHVEVNTLTGQVVSR